MLLLLTTSDLMLNHCTILLWQTRQTDLACTWTKKTVSCSSHYLNFCLRHQMSDSALSCPMHLIYFLPCTLSKCFLGRHLERRWTIFSGLFLINVNLTLLSNKHVNFASLHNQKIREILLHSEYRKVLLNSSTQHIKWTRNGEVIWPSISTFYFINHINVLVVFYVLDIPQWQLLDRFYFDLCHYVLDSPVQNEYFDLKKSF
jgi:hypothetical protein